MLCRAGILAHRSVVAALAVAIGACTSSADRAAGPDPSQTLPPPSNPATPGPARLNVVPSPSLLIPGTRARTWAWIANARPMELVWRSSDPSVANIADSRDGWAMLDARNPGSATITVYGTGTDTVRYSVTVRFAPTAVTALDQAPIAVSAFKVMYRMQGDEMYYAPLATIAPRAGVAIVVRMHLTLPGILPAPGCSMERRFTQSAPLFGKAYGDWELEISTTAKGLPTAAPVLHLLVLDAEGSLHRVDVPGELIPFDPELDWPSQFAGVSMFCG